MKRKWVTAMYLSMLLPMLMAGGCGKDTNGESTAGAVGNVPDVVQAAETTAASEEKEKPEKPAPQEDGSRFMMQVNSVEDSVITGEKEEMPKPPEDGKGSKPPKGENDKQGPGGPEGKAPEGEKPDGDKPDAEKPGAGTPKEGPEGEAMPEMGSGESVSITVTDEAEILKGGPENQTEAALSDIKEGMRIEVVLGEEDVVTEIHIMEEPQEKTTQEQTSDNSES